MESPLAAGTTDLATGAAELEALLEAGRLATLGELARGCAHELNNPLFAILTLVGFVRQDVDPGSRAAERLRLVEESANEMRDVVAGMQRFARESSSSPEAVSLVDVARGAAGLVRRLGAQPSVEIVERYADGRSLVAGDVDRLTLLFVNLLLNACRSLPAGGVVAIEVERAAGEIVATVSDDGPGFGPGEAERAFAPFWTARGGSGLGLAVCRAIAVGHGGTLVPDETAAAGARLVLRLPEAA